MITLEDLVQDALVGLGQVLITPSDLELTDQRVYDGIFYDSFKEYQRFRPVVRTVDIEIPSDGWTIPSWCLKVIRLRRRDVNVSALGYNIYHSSAAPLEFEIRDGKIFSVPGFYNVEYMVRLTLSPVYPEYEAYQAAPEESQVVFKLPGAPRLPTVKVSVGNQVVTAVSGVFPSGGFISSTPASTVDSDGNVVLNVVPPLSTPVRASFYLKYPGVVELDPEERPFYDLFASKFLVAYANLRSNVPVENLPFNITTEDLVSQAQARLSAFNESMSSQGKWWIF